MEKKPLYIAISSQKGGVGKSTITSVLASVLHYTRGYRVAVVDCDTPQHSIYAMRQRDIDAVQTSDRLKVALYRQFEKIKKKTFPVIRSETIRAFDDLEEYCKNYKEEFDIVLFDLPGTLSGEAVVFTISEMDYIFMPIIADNMIMQSTLQFAEVCHEELVMKGNCNLKGVYLFWNKIDRRERQQLYTRWTAVIVESDLKVLQTRLPNTMKFNREAADQSSMVFRSTIFPPEGRYMASAGITSLTDEILSIVKPDEDEPEKEI